MHLETNHNTFINRAITLAIQAGKSVKSNPLVGCVITHHDSIIGEGYHREYGGMHAEVNAISSVSQKALLANSTMYITLEPCNHQGKTPPCCDAIIAMGIPRVIIGCQDPTPIVNGSGIQRLLKNGVEVIVLNDLSCQELIKPFIVNQTFNRPHIILKYAQSRQGYMGNISEEVHLSNPSTDILVHKWRSQVDGILIGTQTAIVDNPQLTTRLYPGDNPTRIVFDYNQRIPVTNHLFTDNIETIILTKNIKKTVGSVQYMCASDPSNLNSILTLLQEKGIHRLLVEGGRYTLDQFIKTKNWDEARVITSHKPLNSGIKSPILIGKLIKENTINNDKIAYISP